PQLSHALKIKTDHSGGADHCAQGVRWSYHRSLPVCCAERGGGVPPPFHPLLQPTVGQLKTFELSAVNCCSDEGFSTRPFCVLSAGIGCGPDIWGGRSHLCAWRR
ncbi:MAG: hypothetical protein MI923_04965, partial [Phycisphaerales bacterium]|nr:hypothetical protein [Phycisphaerales bacterium]